MDEDTAVEEPPSSEHPARAWDIGKRLASGVVFAAITLALAWAGQMPFALLVLVAGLLMSWEWCRVVRGNEFDLTLVVHGAAVLAATVLTAFGYAALGLSALVIGAIIVVPLEFGQRPIFSAAGVLYCGLPAVALLWLRGDEPMGFLAVLFIFLVVWATDTAAFVAGRVIGGPKLAPRISPHKTWAGLAGGVAAAGITAAVFAVLTGAQPGFLLLIGLAMGLIAQFGDLAESALKRTFGVKDASNLIPGHGGFLDRLDGIVTVAVATALAALFVNPHAPAAALFSTL
jgi:phosphatidate cytidylyltransferase